MTKYNSKEAEYVNPTLLPTPEGGIANVGNDLVGGRPPRTGTTTLVPLPTILPENPPPPDVPNPYTNTLPKATPTIPYNRPAAPPTTLNGIVSVSKTSSDRQYLKGSARKIADDYIVTTNTSNVLTVAINLTGTAGVTFEPPAFNLSPLEQKTVTIHFDYVQFEALSEGLNQINTILDVSAISMIELPVTTTQAAIALPAAYQPADNPSLHTFPIKVPGTLQGQVVGGTLVGSF